MSANTEATYPRPLYHPFIKGCTHQVANAQEDAAWQEQGWVVEKPDYDSTGATVETVQAPAKAEAKSRASK